MESIITSFGLDWKIVLPAILNFLLVIGILYFVLYKKVFLVLEERQKKIAEGVKKHDQAEQIISDAEAKRKKMFREADEKIVGEYKEFQQNLNQEKEEVLKYAKVEADKIISNSKQTAEETKEGIIKSADKEIAKMAILATEKILAEK